MLKLIFRRLLEAVPTLLVLITVSFFMMRLAPGSPFTGERTSPPAVLANIEAKYHLNDPLYLQYFHYLKQLAQGDFGPSFKYKDYTVNELLAQAFPVSLELGIYAFIVALLLGVALGVWAALKHNSWLDYTLMGVAMTGVVVPGFVKAPLLVLVFAITLEMAARRRLDRRRVAQSGTAGGRALAGLCGEHRPHYARLDDRGDEQPLIRTARAKGLPMRHIVLRHALRPAMLPVVSYLGPAFVGIITGSIVIETIFGLPGIGQLFVNGALNRDYGMVLSLTILVGALTIAFNAVVDILYALIDPKIRY